MLWSIGFFVYQKESKIDVGTIFEAKWNNFIEKEGTHKQHRLSAHFIAFFATLSGVIRNLFLYSLTFSKDAKKEVSTGPGQTAVNDIPIFLYSLFRLLIGL